MRAVSTKTLVVVGLLLALLIAGGLSVYASTRPDGLQRVAGDHGLSDRAVERDRPGVMPDDQRAAGVVGLLVVLVLATGTTYALRRRSQD